MHIFFTFYFYADQKCGEIPITSCLYYIFMIYYIIYNNRGILRFFRNIEGTIHHFKQKIAARSGISIDR